MADITSSPRLEPNLTDVLLKLKSDIFNNLNCVKVGKIVSFDGTKKTAKVQILFKRAFPDGTVRSHSQLNDVPVFTLQGNGAAIQPPIAAGDQCLLFFADRNIDLWYQNGNEAAPADGRTHNLSDGFALVGVNALNSSLENYATDEFKLTYGGAKISLKGGKIILSNATTDLLTAILALINVLETIAVTDETGTWPINAASIAALENSKIAFQALLKTS